MISPIGFLISIWRERSRVALKTWRAVKYSASAIGLPLDLFLARFHSRSPAFNVWIASGLAASLAVLRRSRSELPSHGVFLLFQRHSTPVSKSRRGFIGDSATPGKLEKGNTPCGVVILSFNQHHGEKC
jgi:hypothetical protein